MTSTPRLAKAHSKLIADELSHLGWELVTEFRAESDEEPYEYLFRWPNDSEPIHIDWDTFDPHGRAIS